MSQVPPGGAPSGFQPVAGTYMPTAPPMAPYPPYGSPYGAPYGAPPAKDESNTGAAILIIVIVIIVIGLIILAIWFFTRKGKTPAGSSCGSNSDCVSGTTCSGGICVLAAGATCTVPASGTNNPCPAGNTCVPTSTGSTTGICTVSSGSIAAGSACTPPTGSAPNPCASGSACVAAPSGSSLPANVCLPIVGSPCFTVGTIPAATSYCSTGNNCSQFTTANPTLVCVATAANTYGGACTGTGQGTCASSSLTCINSICLISSASPCELNSECATGTCSSNACS